MFSVAQHLTVVDKYFITVLNHFHPRTEIRPFDRLHVIVY